MNTKKSKYLQIFIIMFLFAMPLVTAQQCLIMSAFGLYTDESDSGWEEEDRYFLGQLIYWNLKYRDRGYCTGRDVTVKNLTEGVLFDATDVYMEGGVDYQITTSGPVDIKITTESSGKARIYVTIPYIEDQPYEERDDPTYHIDQAYTDLCFRVFSKIWNGHLPDGSSSYSYTNYTVIVE